MGFYVRAIDGAGGVDVAWPSAPSSERVPNDWGDLEFSVTPVPEFAAGPSLFFLGILVAAVVLLKKKPEKSEDPRHRLCGEEAHDP